jgi:hypothetical protein
MENWTNSIGYVLNQSGLSVQFAADVPSDLSNYDLVVLSAYWAVEPSQCQLFKDYINNGGGVVILSGIPEFFRTYCKSWWTYNLPTDPASTDMDQWLACDGNYFNTGGTAYVSVDNPFGTTLKSGDLIMTASGESNAGIMNPYNGSTIIASWQNGVTFAYTYTYGKGRVYFQASYDCLTTGASSPPPPPPSGSTVLYIDPANVSHVAVGSNFTLTVNVDNVANLFTWQICVQFDPSVLNCVQAVYPSSGDYIFAGKTQVQIPPIIDNTAGNVTLGASLMGDDSASGNGSLCEITFNVTVVGESSINFSQPYGDQTFLLDVNMSPIPVTLQNSAFSNDPIGDITGPNGVPDGIVDMRDVGTVARHFGTTPASPNWDPACDITGPQYLVPDGKVDMRDVGLVARNFGK